MNREVYDAEAFDLLTLSSLVFRNNWTKLSIQ